MNIYGRIESDQHQRRRGHLDGAAGGRVRGAARCSTSSSVGGPAVAKYALRGVALVYLLFLLVLPVGLIGWRTFERRPRPGLRRADHRRRGARLQGDAPGRASGRWCSTPSSASVTALLLARRNFPGKRHPQRADRPAAGGLAGGRRARADPGVRQVRAGRRLAGAARHPGHLLARPGMVLATVFVSLPLVVRAIVPVLRGDGRGAGAGRAHAGRRPVADVPPDHHPRHPLGARLRRGALPGPGARRVRRGGGGLRPAGRRRPRP